MIKRGIRIVTVQHKDQKLVKGKVVCVLVCVCDVNIFGRGLSFLTSSFYFFVCLCVCVSFFVFLTIVLWNVGSSVNQLQSCGPCSVNCLS